MIDIGIKAATIDEFGSKNWKAVRVEGNRVLIVKLDDGYHAIDEICSHEEESLAGGFIDGVDIECPRHGATFDITTGAVRSLPAVCPLRIHHVTVRGNDIYISIGSSRSKPEAHTSLAQ
ncbi:MAG: non-heme iron oxygenase ferredoxin subunit [Bacteroidota bacterium]